MTTRSLPLLLPFEIVQMLRGQRGYTEESKDIAELGIFYYQDGEAGQAYKEPETPGSFPHPWSAEVLNQFLRACWERGRKDAGVADL